MSDNIVDFDLSKPVAEVKKFDDALDRLNRQMDNINKRDFRKLVAEVENMRNIGTEAQRKFATDAAATANKIMQSWDLSAMSKKQRAELKTELAKLQAEMVQFYKTNLDVAKRYNEQHWKQLLEGARRNGRSFSEISFTTDNEIIAGRVKTYKTLRQLEDSYNAALRTGHNSTGSGATASVRARVAGSTNALGMFVPEVPEPKLPDPTKINSVSGALRKFAIDSNDAHSAARGLASGFNLLWLTWGNLVPLFAGATISHGFRTIVAAGSEVQHTLTQIKVLAGATVSEVQQLNTQMLELARTGPYAPREIAESMKVLSLAGLDAKAVMAAIPDVLNFAVAGTTDLKTAADTLTTIGVAFNISAKNYSYISDVISKAAAESKSSVEGISEAFKTASVIHQQYGVSLEDTAVSLALLANAGIQGSAAGTAMRNMYADLAGRTPKVEKALKQLGVEAIDPLTGKMREQAIVFKDMVTKLSEYTPEAQSKLISTIFSERGAKDAIAIMNALRKQAEETGVSVGNAYDTLAEKIAQSAGFAAIAAAELSLTPLNQMKQVASTLEATLVGVFNEIQPYVLELATHLQNVFKGDEFKSAVQGVAVTVAELVKLFTENIATVANLVGGYFIFKGVLGLTGAAMLLLETRAVSAAKGVAGLGLAMQMLTKGNPIMLAITALVTAGAAAWGLYALNADKAKTASESFSDASAEALLSRLDQEYDRLTLVNNARILGISLQEAEARAALEKARNEESPALKAAREAVESMSGPGRDKQIYYAVPANIRQREAAEKHYNELLEKRGGVLLQIEARTEQIANLNKLAADSARKEMEESRKNIASGLKDFGGATGATGAGRRTYQDIKIASENTLSIIQKNYNTQKSLAQEQANDERAILEAKHKANLISEGQYQAELQANVLTAEQNLLRNSKAAREKYTENLAEQMTEIVLAIAKAESTPVKNQADIAARNANVEALRQQLQNYAQTAEAHLLAVDADIKKTASNLERVLAVAAINAAGAIKKLYNEDRAYWKADAEAVKKIDTASKLADKYQFVADTVLSAGKAEQAYDEAFSASFEKHLAYVTDLDQKYKDAQDSVEAFARSSQGWDQDELERQKQAAKTVLDLANTARSNAWRSATVAGERAFEDMRKKQIGALSSSLADGIMTGLEEGGEAGKKKLRDTIVNELKKPVFMVINAVINASLSSLLGGVMGGGAIGGGAIGGGGGGSLMGLLNVGSSINSALTNGISGSISSAFSTFAGSGVGQSLGLSNSAAIMGNNPSAFVPAGGQLTSLGSSIGSGLGMLGSGLAGYGISSALSGGYSAGKGVNTIAGIASAIPGIGPIAGVIGGITNRAFGRKLKDSGIEGTLGGTAGFEGSAYDFYKGGWFRSDKTKYKDLDPTVSKGLSDAFKSIQAQVGTFATVLGLNADKVASFTTDIKVSFKGLDGAGTQAALAEALAKGSNELAEQVLGSWTSYAKEGEKAIDTLTRLATNLTTVNTAFKNLGWTLMDKSLAGADAASKFAEKVGGLENFISLSNTYYENFYTEAERTANTTRDVAEALAKVGLEMPKTREGFRALVESQMALGDAGTDTMAALLKVSGAFAEITPAADTAANSVDKLVSALESAFPSATTTIKNLVTEVTRLSRLRNVAGNLKDKIAGAMGGDADFAKKREAELWAALAGTTDLEKQVELAEELSNIVIARQQKEISNAESLLSFSKSLKNYVDSLKIGDLSPLTTGQKLAEAARQYSETLAKARGGDTNAQQNLESAADSYLNLARTYYASSSAYSDIFNSVTGALSGLGTSVKTQAEQQLEIGTGSLAELQRLYGTAESISSSIELQYNSTVEQLKTERDALASQLRTEDEFKAFNQLFKNLPIELAGLFRDLISGVLKYSDERVAQAIREVKISDPLSTISGITDAAYKNFGITSEQIQRVTPTLYSDAEVASALRVVRATDPMATLDAIRNVAYMNYGITAEQFDRVVRMDGSHYDGLDYVPFNGYRAELHVGERVLTAAENSQYSGNEGLLQELAALRHEVQLLRESNRQEADRQLEVTIKAAEVIGETVSTATSKAAHAKVVQEKATIR